MSQDQSDLSFGLAEPDLQWNDTGQPYSTEYQDIYFSRTSGLDETEHVFIEGNRLRQRFSELNRPQQNQNFTVAETGFGTGLNFLTTCSIWDQIDTGDACLHFISVEKAPLSRQQLQQAFQIWPELKPYQERLLDGYPERLKGIHRLHFPHQVRVGSQKPQANIQLTLLFGDALEMLQQLSGNTKFGVNAWFLDGFAPSRNPDLWSPELFSEIGRLSASNATFSSYTAAGHVRRGMEAVGFEIEKVPGFGTKREMSRGVLSSEQFEEPEQPNQSKPWFTLPSLGNQTDFEKKAVVIGAGMAGCNAAYSLAQRGWQVELLDAGEAVATGASGNPQGILYTRFSSTHSSSAEFSLFSYLFAKKFYRQLSKANSDQSPFFFPCGVIQLAFDEKEQQRLRAIVDKTALSEDVVQWLTAEQVNERSGVHVDIDGLLFSGGGWLIPSKLCQVLSEHPNITRRFAQPVAELVPVESNETTSWQLLSEERNLITEASVVIVACAEQSNRLIPGRPMPAKAIRGQVTLLPSNPVTANLQSVLCTDGYIAPPNGDNQCIGATYNFGSTNTEINPTDHQTNLDNLGNYLPELHRQIMDSCEPGELHPEHLAGRVGFRCTTPDYLPIVGPLPNTDAFLSDYAILKKDKTIPVQQPGCYHPGLYTLMGMGSKGLAYAPLCGELLASMICNEPLPVGRELAGALNPSRFLIRDLIKNRV
ncbi:MAG: bifunctional tRNA (5-methylaminomethyl-2-thiouridine)(34)-methyltransferase MnmD/FAD-dependent 5-carboxymethylaminomethyl-2-thiouridine(34) oxidoreductase MnmC [Pseudomonadales bacterium]|nr:bifunctional tRNA (5-methylaminomethyl-2-thiouridine)(34)-methyltransferase MnmD/FAD-dependent 5-carboxymethylaminomethyl-2-thiouridine(34) oxidoreductase MnmC [Pseudomonadales bacterium]